MSSLSFGRLLKEQRRTRDLTQEQLAELVGCAVVTLKKIEAGSLRPSRQIAERLAEALGVSPDERAAFVAQARGAASAPETPPDAQTALAAETPSSRTLRGYELRERIGVGGFGVVYRAVQPAVGRDVAIKAIHPHYADQPSFIRRFAVEAQLVARLEHPHIVPLYDYWREPGSAYLVMRYLRGGNLAEALQRGPWALPAAARLVDQIGAALHAAHRAGVVHRDVKPANILLDPEGNAYLADFGIAKDIDRAAERSTQPGAVVGSPEYLSPEQLRDEPVTPQTDVYSLGLVLYELLSGANPFAGLSPAERLQRQLHTPLPSLRALRPDLADAFDAVIARATAKQAAQRFPDVPRLIEAVQQAFHIDEPAHPVHDGQTIRISAHVAAGKQLLPARTLTSAVVHTAENPYKGLRAFQASDAHSFFGREALTRRLLARLAEAALGVSALGQELNAARFLAVIGPSGSGKSSAVLAGLLPAIRRGALPGSAHWFIAEAVPGADPLEEIEAALLRVAVNPPPSLLEQLRADERGLTRAVKRALPADARVELVLVIDQFEELFTLVAREDDRAHLLRSLLVAVTDPRSRLRLIITLRADFYDRPLLYAGFSELVRLRTEVVTPLTTTELARAITKPAEQVGVTVEPALVDAITHDVAAQPGALPLVQYALTELFERRDGNVMTLERYHALGGIAGALAQRADALYAALDAGGQFAARQVFLRLVTPGEGVEDTRRRVHRAELVAADGRDTNVDAVLDAYGRHRLLTFDREAHTGAATVEVAHEALIRVWDRLRGWLDESRAALLALRRLAQAAAEWAQANYEIGFLAAGGRLAQFESLADADLTLSDAERRYLEASIAERERVAEAERARQEQLRESLAYSEAQRLAIESLRIVQDGGNAEVAALLAIRSIRTRYTPQGDEAVVAAALQPFALRIFEASGINLAITPDGNAFIVAGFGPEAHMIDIATGAILRVFAGSHSDLINNVRVSPDGRYLATSGTDGIALLWDVATGERLVAYRGHTTQIMGLAFWPNSQHLLTASDDGTARLWDVATGEELRRFVVNTNLISGAVCPPDGQRIVTAGSDGTTRLWDVATGVELLSLTAHTGSVMSCAVSPDGRRIATGAIDATVRVWDVQTGAECYCCRGHSEAVQRVVFSPDGTLVASCGDDGTVRLWDSGTGREVRRLVGINAFAFAVAFSPDGKHLISTSGGDTSRLWQVGPAPYLRSFDGVVAAFAPDEQCIAAGGLDGVAHLWDARTGELRRTFSCHSSEITSIAFTPDGTRLLTGSADTTARVWDVATGDEVLVLRGHTQNTRPVASADGRLLLTASDDRTARLWDAQTGALLRVITQNDQIFDAAFSPDMRLVATGSVDGTTRLWQMETGTQLRLIEAPAASLTFLPDGNTLVTGDWGGRIRLWDVQTGAEVGALHGHTTTVWDLRVSPDGRWLLSASGDRTARLWDLTTRQEVRRFAGHSAGVYTVDFSPDGRHVLTASIDGSARLWDIDYHTTVDYLCGRLLRDLTDDERAQYGLVG